MKFKLIAAITAVVALAGFSSAQAQDCGCSSGYGAYAGVVESGSGDFGSYGNVGYNASTCFRALSSSAASSLWSGYCTEDCSYKGPARKKLLGGCKGRHGGGCGLGSGSSGGGCFDYPSGGCGTPSCGFAPSYVSSVRGGHFGGCGLKQKLSAKHGCGQRGGCLTGGCGGGGKLRGKLKDRKSSCGCSAPVSECSSCLSGACDSCGDCDGGSYFSEAVGYEYGNGGMQSYVSGSLTSACGCGG